MVNNNDMNYFDKKNQAVSYSKLLSTTVNNYIYVETIFLSNIDFEGKAAGRWSAFANRQKTIYNPVLPFAGIVKPGSLLPPAI